VVAQPQAAPEPDFLVEASGHRIGIEHTRLIRLKDENGISFMAHHQIANRIMREAETRFNQQHDFCLMVHADFRCDYGLAVAEPVQLYNQDIKELSAYIADFVGKLLPDMARIGLRESLHFETYDWDTLEKILPDKLNSLTIYNTKSFKRPLWSAYQGSTVPGISPAPNSPKH